MADKVTQKDGSWSDTTVWNGGTLPTSGQTIQISHNVIYDVDTSGFAAGHGAISIDAGKSITASTTAGAYYMKMAGSITGAGAGAELRAGTSETAYPSNCTFTIYMNGNYSIDGGASNTLTCKFYCYDPPVKYLRLISATPKAITGISKGTTCTVTCVGHGYSAGDTIVLVDVGGMVELDNQRVKVKTVVDADSFTLRWYDYDVTVDSSLFTSYTSGGYVCPETAEAIGQTQLEVDQDVSADPEWTRSGATVMICNINRANNPEARTISSVASGSVTVSAGLTAAKLSGSYVVLTTRNVMLITASTTSSGNFIYRGSGHVLNCGITQTSSTSLFLTASHTNSTFDGVISATPGYCTGFNGAANLTCTGILTGVSTGFNAGSGISLSGLGVGCGQVFNHPSSAICKLTSTGIIEGCTYAVNNVGNVVISGIVRNNQYAGYPVNKTCFDGALVAGNLFVMYYGSASLINAKFVNNLRDSTNVWFRARNTLFASSFEASGYLDISQLSESFDHDQIAGAYRAWTRGGITSSTATDPPTGRVRSYQTVCESATYPGWYQREIVVDAGRQLRFRVWLKADAGVEIKAQLVLPTADPLVTGTGTGEWQQIGTSDGTWYEYITSWTNSATYPVTIYARVLSTAASGNGYSDMMWAFDRTPLVR